MTIETIHLSLINGQRRQMVDQIKEYGLYNFFDDYKGHLSDMYHEDSAYKYFTDATISYFRIEER